MKETPVQRVERLLNECAVLLDHTDKFIRQLEALRGLMVSESDRLRGDLVSFKAREKAAKKPGGK